MILLDIMMPDMDGYSVCRRLKVDEGTKDIPVIFVTALSEAMDEAKAFELGGVDYITKPFVPVVVKARVKTHLKLRDAMVKLQDAMQELKRLYSMALDANPMTKLPGNNSVAARIEQALERKENACVIYSDLDNFKAFNDKYGFALGDDVILYTSEILKSAITGIDESVSFVGHIGGDDFVVIVPSGDAKAVSERITIGFDDGVKKFYTAEDAAAGCIQSRNRQGEKQTFPLMSISLAGVDLSHGIYKKYIEVNDACAETKKKAKEISGSSFVVDRRKTSISDG